MPRWWFRIPRIVRVGIAIIVLWQILLVVATILGTLAHPGICS